MLQGAHHVNGGGDGLRCELHLINVELLVHHISELLVVHFATTEYAQRLVLETLVGHTFSGAHLGFDRGKLFVAVVDLFLDDFTTVA